MLRVPSGLMEKCKTLMHIQVRQVLTILYLRHHTHAICICADVNAQSPQWADDKIQYSEYHRPSRPYIDQQARNEIDSVASELQNAENSRSRG